MNYKITPQWVSDVRGRYAGPCTSHPGFSTTIFGRHHKLSEPIGRYLQELKPAPSILQVGVGADNPAAGSFAYEPLDIVAALDSIGRDFRMVVLDISGSNLAGMNGKQTVKYRPGQQSPEQVAVWHKYLRDTNQSPLIRRSYRRDDLVEAPVPRSFRSRVEKKQIEFVKGDVVLTDLRRFGPFNFIRCLNIFPHLYSSDVDLADASIILALYNMSQSMANGGILMVDDGRNDYDLAALLHPDPAVARRLFWDTFVRNKLEREGVGEELKLSVEEEIRVNDAEYYLILRKAA